MLTIIAVAVVAVAIFVGGVLTGAANAPSVDKAIAALKQAEANAQATLAKITAHKAS